MCEGKGGTKSNGMGRSPEAPVTAPALARWGEPSPMVLPGSSALIWVIDVLDKAGFEDVLL